MAPEPPVLFIHVMKTGGTTISRNLRETYPLEQIYPSAAHDLEYAADGELDLEHHVSVPYNSATRAFVSNSRSPSSAVAGLRGRILPAAPATPMGEATHVLDRRAGRTAQKALG